MGKTEENGGAAVTEIMKREALEVDNQIANLRRIRGDLKCLNTLTGWIGENCTLRNDGFWTYASCNTIAGDITIKVIGDLSETIEKLRTVYADLNGEEVAA